MKKVLVIILIGILFWTLVQVCSNNSQPTDEVIIDNNVDSETLLYNIDSYVEHDGKIIDNNKELSLTFTFKKGVTVPTPAPAVQAKIYLWMDDHLIGIYSKPLYNNYEDYGNPVTLKFKADGKAFNRYDVALEGSI